jgi:hypothetical protein
VSDKLQSALDDLGGAGGGTLVLEPGRYVCDQALFIHDSNVVLAGAGRHETTLWFSRPLAECVAPGHHWSWTGGHVFFVARERLEMSMAQGWSYAIGDEGWLAGARLADVGPSDRGACVVTVDDTQRLRAGVMVLLEVSNPSPQNRLLREMAGNVEGAATFPWGETLLDGVTWQWPVVIAEVLSRRTVRLEQPLRVALHPETPAIVRELGPTVHDSGVEALTIENDLRAQTTHNLHPGSNGVGFQAVHDCWAIDVHVTNADVAFSMTCAKSCTLSGISAGGRSLHHFTATRESSHDNLIEDFVLEDFNIPAVEGSYLHGINVEGLSSGNVWRRGMMHTGTFDSHRRLPFENLRTDITVVNKDAVPGGSFDSGPQFGARSVHWGITVQNGNNLCMDITDVAPRSCTAGIVGLDEPGSFLRGVPSNSYFEGDLESECISLGEDLGDSRDLLEVQRRLAAPRS